MSESDPTRARIALDTASVRRFGALRDRHSRPYLISAGLSMLGDNNEHVITYWVLWQRFHSPALVGFEVISHWLPFLVLSVPFGALAERLDCRRLVQVAQLLFALVSASWGVLFLTGGLQLWEACFLLVLHGCAGALWAPAEQLLLHDFAPVAELPSIVRLNSTFRGLGTLSGPLVGALLLFGLGPVAGILTNMLFYLPMSILMARTPFTGHGSSTESFTIAVPFPARSGTFGTIRRDPLLVRLIVLSAISALCVGGSLQAAMPSFATRLEVGSGGLAYGLLLFANGVGGVIGGFVLEATGVLRPSARTATATATAFGLTSVAVALTGSYWLAIAALLLGGVANLATTSVTQAIVQLRAPTDRRGRIVGIFNMFSQGFRVGNGVTLAVVGSLLSVSTAVAIGAAGLAGIAAVLGISIGLGRRPGRVSDS